MDFLEKVKVIHIIGIGGISLSALAIILQTKGIIVSGSDKALSPLTQKLEDKGICVVQKMDKTLIEKADLVVYTSAISKDDQEMQYALALKKKVCSRAELLGYFSRQYYTISVAGSHGKTTVSSMIGHLFVVAGKDPTIHVGGIMKEFDGNVRLGKSKYFITEACEYKDSFLHLSSDIAVILNEDPDHLDYFKNNENYYKSFEKFAKNIKKEGVLIVNYDDLFARRLKFLNCFSYAVKSRADLQAINIKREEGFITFEFLFMGLNFGKVRLKALGTHNVYNALATIAVGIASGISLQIIKEALESFEGVERRLEFVGGVKGGEIIHDYAHHPDEIIASIKAVKESENRHIISIFQPHTFTRTRDLYYEFCRAFIESDEVWLLPVYPAREKPIPKITSKFLAKGISKYNKIVRYFSNFDKCYSFINKIADQDKIFLIMGAGDIVSLAYKFKKNDELK